MTFWLGRPKMCCFQSTFLLPGSASLYPIQSIEPWTPELALRRQDEKVRERSRKRDQEEADYRQSMAENLAEQIARVDSGSGIE
jgi:hypothetical protein